MGKTKQKKTSEPIEMPIEMPIEVLMETPLKSPITILNKLNEIIKSNADFITPENVHQYERYEYIINSDEFISSIIKEDISKSKKQSYSKIISTLSNLLLQYKQKQFEGQLEKPMRYNFKCSYVNLKDIYFSQDTVTLKLDYTYINNLICEYINSPIRIVTIENNVFFTGYWGLEGVKDFSDEKYIRSEYIPMIEVIDNSVVYTTINNRRLVTIYLLLYSLMKDKRVKFRYLSNFLTYDIIDDFKEMFKVLDIYIPVVIYNANSCAPYYLMDYQDKIFPPKTFIDENMTNCYKNICREGDDTNCKWQNFLKYRFTNQKSWGLIDDESEFKYGSPFIPYINRISKGKVLPDIFTIPKTPLSAPTFEFESRKLSDYTGMIDKLFKKFGKSSKDYNITPNNICIPYNKNCECLHEQIEMPVKDIYIISKKNAKKRKDELKKIPDIILSPDTFMLKSPIRTRSMTRRKSKSKSKSKSKKIKITKTKKFGVWDLTSSAHK